MITACDACDPWLDCGGHGSCQPDDSCLCDTGWAGAACDVCDLDWYPAGVCDTFCDAPTTCRSAGTCDTDGSCLCDAGTWGPSCLPCAGSGAEVCGGHGSCDAGMGACDCEVDYYGARCDVCENPLFAWGDDTDFAVQGIQGIGNAIGVSVGSSYGIALHADGTLIGWGNDWYGQASGASRHLGRGRRRRGSGPRHRPAWTTAAYSPGAPTSSSSAAAPTHRPTPT